MTRSRIALGVVLVAVIGFGAIGATAASLPTVTAEPNECGASEERQFSGVTNPVPAEGGADAEPAAPVRTGVPGANGVNLPVDGIPPSEPITPVEPPEPILSTSQESTGTEPADQLVIAASDSAADLVRFDIDGDGDFDRTTGESAPCNTRDSEEAN